MSIYKQISLFILSAEQANHLRYVLQNGIIIFENKTTNKAKKNTSNRDAVSKSHGNKNNKQIPAKYQRYQNKIYGNLDWEGTTQMFGSDRTYCIPVYSVHKASKSIFLQKKKNNSK